LRTGARATPERLTGVITTRRNTNPRLLYLYFTRHALLRGRVRGGGEKYGDGAGSGVTLTGAGPESRGGAVSGGDVLPPCSALPPILHEHSL